MKVITRTISVNVYTFANIDLASGRAVNIHTVESAVPLTQRQISDHCGQTEDCVCIKQHKEERKYTIPVERFISACEAYAAEQNTDKREENQ